MIKVIDTKPSGGSISNVKPSSGNVINIVPRISKVYNESILWSSTGRGMPIGLLLSLTYCCDRRL